MDDIIAQSPAKKDKDEDLSPSGVGSKQQLRAEVARQLAEIGPAALADRSQIIEDAVVGWPLFCEAQTIFCYVSVPGEPETWGLLDAALSAGKTVLVPRCHKDGTMEAVEIYGLEDLTEEGTYGIPEPRQDRTAQEPGVVDLAIVPCVTCDKQGHRLGHGMGYYDRYLAQTDCQTVVLCFEDIMRDRVPIEELDRRMDYVATEKGIRSSCDMKK